MTNPLRPHRARWAALPLAAGLLVGVPSEGSAQALQNRGSTSAPPSPRWPVAAARVDRERPDPRAWSALGLGSRTNGAPPPRAIGWESEEVRSPRSAWMPRSLPGESGYARPWPQLPGSAPVGSAMRSAELPNPWVAPASPLAGPAPFSQTPDGSTPDALPQDVQPWDIGPRTGWGGTPPAEVRYGIRIMPGYLDPTDPPPVGRPLRWRYVQAELSALFGDYTGFGLAAATPLDKHWYGRLGLRFGELFSQELDSDQCELALGYRWPQPVFDLWGEAYAELGMRVGEIEDDNATGPRLEVGHRSRIAEPLELQVAVGLDASLPNELHAEELYVSSQLEWALGDRLALRFESELADVSVFRFVLRHYF